MCRYSSDMTDSHLIYFKYCIYILIFYYYYFGFCLKGHYGENGDNYISGSYNFKRGGESLSNTTVAILNI